MNPLADYLSRHQITHQAFATRIGVHQSTVTRLCDEKASMLPGIGTALAIERETSGEVKTSAWLERKNGPGDMQERINRGESQVKVA